MPGSLGQVLLSLVLAICPSLESSAWRICKPPCKRSSGPKRSSSTGSRRCLPTAQPSSWETVLPIREWNAFANWEDRNLRPFANRGANGIDGLLSTYLGISADESESWAIVGDLSALYDLNAPWVTPQLSPGKRRIVVVNNGGGAIFHTLPALDAAPDAAREMMINPHSIRLRGFAEMWGWEYLELTEPKLDQDLADHVVIEIVI